ncbi:MAG: ankyrin repeat domain-containing protein, partial [Planctomycetes bacterium]|nr:ankyrin repeat domain-containing protein [Planctomycetota bacterium]
MQRTESRKRRSHAKKNESACLPATNPILSFAALAGSEPGISFQQIVRTDDFAKIKLLIIEGANVNEPDQNGFTPLQHAAKYGNETAVKLLIASGANVDVKSEDGRSLLQYYLLLYPD